MTHPFFFGLVRLWYFSLSLSPSCSDLMMMLVPRYLFYYPHAFRLLSVLVLSVQHANCLSFNTALSFFFTQIDRVSTHTSLSLFSFPSHSPVRLPTLAFLPLNCCLIATFSTHIYTRIQHIHRHGTAEKTVTNPTVTRLTGLAVGLALAYTYYRLRSYIPYPITV
jgi:hypothetical protein